MSGKVTLRVSSGPIAGSVFTFEGHDTFVFGRSSDCHARLSPDDHATSRHHFIIETNPPQARLRDLGSLNGTYVGGRRFGGRARDESPEQAALSQFPEVDLRHGDEIRVGRTVLAVEIEGAADAFARETTDAVEALLEAPRIPGYELAGILGRGGMGVVYSGSRLADGSPVAVKVLLPRTAADANAREVFRREIEVMRRLSHPRVVEVLDHGRVEGAFFFVMERCAGGSLDDFLRRSGGVLARPAALRIALEALDGLAHAHAAGFVHRDLKPENILLGSPSGEDAKVTDFGLAKSFETAGLSGLTATGTIAGTFRFMPREQITSFRLGRPASDVWSMAATLYLMLTGQLPRDLPEGKDPIQVILRGGAVPIRRRAPGMPDRLAEVVDRALADDLSVRYQNAGELRLALIEATA
jgi:serine/threonine protein kinase